MPWKSRGTVLILTDSKRWDYQEHALNWGKRKAKWETSQDAEKSYDLPLYCINISALYWYIVGDKQELERLLKQCNYIGKKRSYGNGQVSQWDVIPIESDYHLFKDGNLMRPMPYKLIAPLLDKKIKYDLLQWGWKPPVNIPENQSLCALPTIPKIFSQTPWQLRKGEIY